MRRSLLLLPLLGVAACGLFDDEDPPADPVVFDGVEVEPSGDATLSLEDGALVVSGLDGSRSGGFAVEGDPERVDVETDAVDVRGGQRFGVRVEGDGETLARIDHVGRGGGQADVRFAFAQALEVEAVTVRYRLDGEVVFEIPRLSLFPDERRRQDAASAGTASGDAGSVHVIRQGGKYIVVTDSDELQALRRICEGFFVIPPEPFTSDFPLGVCTDWIEVEPLTEASAEGDRVLVTGQGIGSFTVRDLRVVHTGR